MPPAQKKSNIAESSEFAHMGRAEQLRIQKPKIHPDIATIFGLVLAFSLIGASLIIGGSVLAFFNVPALLIVLGGTLAVTAISYSVIELSQASRVIKQSLFFRHVDEQTIAKELIDIACVVRAQGALALNKAQGELRKNADIYKACQFLIDDYKPEDMQAVLHQDINQLLERHKIGIGILRRAADVAPAMGLIGTLVGLVQMLTALSDPTSIGPAMAVALLTTFYGAVLGTVILSPMAAKLERNSAHELMLRDMIMKATTLIAHGEHPRRLEIFLNTLLPPSKQLSYFS